MTEFILVDNIYVRFRGQLFRQMVDIPMGTNCAPLLADLFLYSYENEFLDKLIKKAKESLLERSLYHIATLMTLSLSIIIKDLRSSFLIFMHQSIPSANTPPSTPLGNFFEVVKSPAPGQNFCAKGRPPGQKAPMPGNIQSAFLLIYPLASV